LYKQRKSVWYYEVRKIERRTHICTDVKEHTSYSD